MADTPEFAEVLRANHKVQAAAGAGTRLLTADEIKAEYPFYMVDDLLLGSLNTKDEGYFDGSTVFDWFRRKAIEAGNRAPLGQSQRAAFRQLDGRARFQIRLDRRLCGGRPEPI